MIVTVVPLVRLPVGIGPFSYSATDDQSLAIGQLVHITFRSKNKMGLIVALTQDQPETTKPLQPLVGVVSPLPFVSAPWCASLVRLAAVYHVNAGTMAISMLPSIGPRMAAAKTLSAIPEIPPQSSSTMVMHTLVDSGTTLDAAVATHVHSFAESTCVIICPESSTVDRVHALLEKQGLSRKMYIYQRGGSTKEVKGIWHAVRRGEPAVVIGTRATALLPFAPGTQALVIHPQDDAHTQWDGQPHTTTLDVLAIRNRAESIHITTITHTATTDMILEHDAWTRAWNPEPIAYTLVDNAQLVRARLYHAIPDPVREQIACATKEHPAVILVNRTDASVVLRCADCETVIASRTITSCPQCNGQNLVARGMSIEYLA